MINLFEEPEIIYKDLLDKKEDLTTNEVIYLYIRGVDKQTIRRATKLKVSELDAILERMDSVIENHKKAVDKMGAITKFNMTKEKAEQLKAEGKKKSEIAKIAGVTLSTYIHHEKKWNGDQPKANEEYNSLIEQLKEQVKQKDGTIEKLQKKIDQLEQDKLDLHAAANDTESELLTDADIWKQQAQMYQGENKRLNDNLSETRQELAKYKGENVLAKAFIKAVL